MNELISEKYIAAYTPLKTDLVSYPVRGGGVGQIHTSK